MQITRIITTLTSLFLLNGPARAETAGPVQLLFLGDQGHHTPAKRVEELKKALGPEAIFITYTENMGDITRENLARYDGLMVYANIGSIEKEPEQAILEFVAGGKGYIPLHCASYCFHNSPDLIALLGAQFKRHGGATFRTRLFEKKHPIMDGFEGFESWDETYVHHKHNEKDRTVLAYRDDEPWTWVRTHGKGRVFYTAWGHDHRTWSNPGFHELVKRGVLWACGDPVRKRWEALNLAKLKFEDRKVPNYEKRDPPPLYQFPLEPEESMKRIQVPAGFSLSLFAAEPQIRNVTAMAWDEKGRLWVAETADYPNHLKPAGEGSDAIKILEDTDRDGRADKVTVWADKLSIPTGMVFARGGLIVSQAPHMLFLKDSDGDDKADVREIMFSGWGTGDTHAGPSSLTYGLDNWIYGSVGYSGFRSTFEGKSVGFGNGFYRFSKDGKKMEFLAKSSNNTWGLGQSETGEWFGSTANNTHSLHIGIPIRYYDGVQGLSTLPSHKLDGHYAMSTITREYRQVDVHGGYTAAAGHTLYTARQYPKEFWNSVGLVNEPTGGVVHLARLIPRGSSFIEEDGRNLFAGADAWVSPVFSATGPDGQVWVADFYDFIIQHNPLPKGFKMGKGNAYETPLRENQRARIYKVGWGKDADRPSLDAGKPETLLAALGNDNMLWRLHGQRMLVERGKDDVVPMLRKMVRESNLDAIHSDPAALHALWTLDGLGVSGASLADGLKHKAASVRKAALEMMPRDAKHRDLLLEHQATLDESPNVQLAALLALAEMPVGGKAGEALARTLKKLEGRPDHWLPNAFSLACIKHADSMLDAIAASLPPPDLNAKGGKGAAVKLINLVPNPSFEDVEKDEPAGWAKRLWSGEPKYELVNEGSTGQRSVKISADANSEAGYYVEFDVQPYMVYRLRGWVKTENVQGGGRGAMFYLPGLNRNASKSFKGTRDWERIEHTFDSMGHEKIRIYCLLGGWGKVTGAAWFDDLEVVALHPSLGDNLNIGVTSVIMRNYAAKADPANLERWMLRLPALNENLVAPLVEGLARGWPAGKTVALDDGQRGQLQGLLDRMTPDKQTDLMKLALKAGVAGLVGKAPPPVIAADDDAVVVKLSVIKDKMLYDKQQFSVPAGKRIKLVFSNVDHMPHNVVIAKPGSLERLGAAADRLMTDVNAVDRGYVPNSNDVLESLAMVFPGQTKLLEFTAPRTPGDYVVVCTFPSHWRLMKAVMKVE